MIEAFLLMGSGTDTRFPSQLEASVPGGGRGLEGTESMSRLRDLAVVRKQSPLPPRDATLRAQLWALRSFFGSRPPRQRGNWGFGPTANPLLRSPGYSRLRPQGHYGAFFGRRPKEGEATAPGRLIGGGGSPSNSDFPPQTTRAQIGLRTEIACRESASPIGGLQG
jgi:hypothetical protein